MTRLARSHDANHIQEVAASATLAFSDEFRAQLLAKLTAARRRNASYGELVHIAQMTIESYLNPLAGIIADSRLAGLLIGGQHVAEALPAGMLPPGSPPRPPWVIHGDEAPDFGDMDRVWRPIISEAVKDLQARQLLLPREWRNTSDAVRQQAFTVARATTDETLKHVRDGIIESIHSGTGLKAFREHMEEKAETSAWGAGELENIQRTGVMTAYSRGMDRVLQTPGFEDVFVYEETLGIPDSRQTELCDVICQSGLQHTGIFRSDDPVYRYYLAPRHWRCRCGRSPMTLGQAARRGIKTAQRWLETGVDPHDYVDWPRGVSLPAGWTPGGGRAVA